MKYQRILITIILTIIIFSCDAFLVPKEERLNPYDDNNPLAQAKDLNINIVDDDTGRFVELGWVKGENSIEQNVYGYLIVRKTEGAAETIYEGIPLNISGTDDFNFKDYYEFAKDVTYYYSIFAYGLKSEYKEDGEDYSLGIESSGELVNYRYFNFTAPVVVYAEPYSTIERIVKDDGYVDTANGWDSQGDNPLYVETASSSAQRIACLSFDLSKPPNCIIDKVTLVLTLHEAPVNGSGEIEFGPLRINWDTNTFFTDLNANGADDTVIYYEYEQRLPCDGSAGDTWEIDITGIFNAHNNSAITANGIRMISFNETHTFSFKSKESPESQPYIRIETYNSN